jgi:hypothetical protein
LDFEEMEPERVSNHLLDYTPRGAGSTGRLKLRWKGQHILQANGTDPKVHAF